MWSAQWLPASSASRATTGPDDSVSPFAMSVSGASCSLPVYLCERVAGSTVISCTYWPDAVAQCTAVPLMLSFTAEELQAFIVGSRGRVVNEA